MSLKLTAPGTPTHGTSTYWIKPAELRVRLYTHPILPQTWTPLRKT